MNKFIVQTAVTVESPLSEKELDSFFRELISDSDGTKHKTSGVIVSVKEVNGLPKVLDN
jgi:hypothetical protein